MSRYTTIGAEELVEKYKTPLGVAVAFLNGQLTASEQYFVPEIVKPIHLEAARIIFFEKKGV